MPEVTRTGVDQEAPVDTTFHIVVNAQEKTVQDRTVTYDDAVKLAWGSVDPKYRYTVTYRNAVEPKRDGIMTQEEAVEIRNGTIFDVNRTYKS